MRLFCDSGHHANKRSVTLGRLCMLCFLTCACGNSLLLSSETDDASIKLCDFGYASRIDPPSGLCLNKTKVGTPAYAAPELISSNIFGAKIDVWAAGAFRGRVNPSSACNDETITRWMFAGVITYILLVGYPPFDHDLSVNEMYESIVNNDIDYEEDDWKGLSPLALEFVQTMLQVGGVVRRTLKEPDVHQRTRMYPTFLTSGTIVLLLHRATKMLDGRQRRCSLTHGYKTLIRATTVKRT